MNIETRNLYRQWVDDLRIGDRGPAEVLLADVIEWFLNDITDMDAAIKLHQAEANFWRLRAAQLARELGQPSGRLPAGPWEREVRP